MSDSAVIYIRVSTEDQADSGLSVQSQEDVCRALAGRKGWPISSIWRDEGVSGSKPLDKRPGLFGAIGALGRGDFLVIAKRDRVFRTDDYDRAVILRAVASRGGRIASAAGECPDDDSPDGRMVATILDAVGARERGAGIARTKAALKVKRDRGQRCGQIPYGWRLADDGLHLEPDPADAGLAEACRRLKTDGASLRAIGRELAALGFRPKEGGAVFGASTIRRILQRGGAA
jgi:site-specific DNA recombinase